MERARRLASRAAVASSLAMLAAGLALSPLNPLVHGFAMLCGAVTLLVVGVASAYAVSIPSPSGRARLLATLAPLMAVPGSIAVTVLRGWEAALPLSLALALGSAACLDSAARSRPGSTTRWSLLGLGYSLAFSSVLLPLALAVSPSPIHAMTAYAFALPVQSIYSVTLHALPSTYRGKPSRLVALAYPLTSISSLAFSFGATGHAALAAAAGLTVFTATAGFTVVPRAIPSIKASTPAAKAHRYFLVGHAYAIAATAVAAGFLLAHAVDAVPLHAALHAVLAGFTAVFVAIHAPLMLPVILGTRTARRYNQAPFIIAVAEPVIWLANRHAGLVAFAAWALSVLLVVKPAGKPSWQRRS